MAELIRSLRERVSSMAYVFHLRFIKFQLYLETTMSE